MKELFYADVEIRKDEDGFDEKYVYVPILDEWMTEEEFYFQKSCYDPAMDEAHVYEQEHGSDDFIDIDYEDYFDEELDEEEYEDIDEDDGDCDYSTMSYEEAVEEYNRTGINHSKYDLNDWDDINRRLGFEFYKPKK